MDNFFFYRAEAASDFNKARTKAVFNRMLGMLWPQRQELLSFEEVKSILQPKAQAYRGMKVVNIDLIVGSEGRYQDFNKQFLPKREHLRKRWTSIDEARLQDVVLPPIQLYELGGVYFVRDGNHRVSVARAQGMSCIDAEVTSLGTEIKIRPDMAHEELKQAVIDYEYREFLRKTKITDYFPDANLRLTATGQYDEIFYHIMVHKYFINQGFEEELPFRDAVVSWYDNVFKPIIEIVQAESLLARFPGRTEPDLYVWIIKHWHYLKEKYGLNISAKDAAVSYAEMFGLTIGNRFKGFLSKIMRKKKTDNKE